MLAKLEENQGQGRTISACDPLLRVLCGQSSTSPEARYIYDEIDDRREANPNEQTTYCNPDTEFPFFGKRLLELQQFDRQHPPQTVRSLLGDKRDVAAWFTLWNNQVRSVRGFSACRGLMGFQLLVFFATFTILLMVVSLGFQIWQTILSKQQVEQGSGMVSSS